MPEPSLGRKISWFLYQKGMGTPKADYLWLAKIGDPMWFKIVDVFFKENNLQARNTALDQLLRTANFSKSNPRRSEYLKLLGRFLNKGIIDERRRAVNYIDANASLFSASDDLILGPLITAQRDSDVTTANTAEEVLVKIRGEVKVNKQDWR